MATIKIGNEPNLNGVLLKEVFSEGNRQHTSFNNVACMYHMSIYQLLQDLSSNSSDPEMLLRVLITQFQNHNAICDEFLAPFAAQYPVMQYTLFFNTIMIEDLEDLYQTIVSANERYRRRQEPSKKKGNQTEYRKGVTEQQLVSLKMNFLFHLEYIDYCKKLLSRIGNATFPESFWVTDSIDESSQQNNIDYLEQMVNLSCGMVVVNKILSKLKANRSVERDAFLGQVIMHMRTKAGKILFSYDDRDIRFHSGNGCFWNVASLYGLTPWTTESGLIELMGLTTYNGVDYNVNMGPLYTTFESTLKNRDMLLMNRKAGKNNLFGVYQVDYFLYPTGFPFLYPDEVDLLVDIIDLREFIEEISRRENKETRMGIGVGLFSSTFFEGPVLLIVNEVKDPETDKILLMASYIDITSELPPNETIYDHFSFRDDQVVFTMYPMAQECATSGIDGKKYHFYATNLVNPAHCLCMSTLTNPSRQMYLCHGDENNDGNDNSQAMIQSTSNGYISQRSFTDSDAGQWRRKLRCCGGNRANSWLPRPPRKTKVRFGTSRYLHDSD